MKRKFTVTIGYEVVIDDTFADPDVDGQDGAVTGLHIMDAVYASQVGDVRGLTSNEPKLAYDAEEINMTWQEIK